eukprot:scaffold23_cov175-Amphora_coffeaeformis.AAC.14
MSLEFPSQSTQLTSLSSNEDMEMAMPAKVSEGSQSLSDTSSVNKNEDRLVIGEMHHESDKECPLLYQRYIRTLKFIEKSEETRNKDRMFSKVYEEGNDKSLIQEDWSTNHYLQKQEHMEPSKPSKSKSKNGESEDSTTTSLKKSGNESGTKNVLKNAKT